MQTFARPGKIPLRQTALCQRRIPESESATKREIKRTNAIQRIAFQEASMCCESANSENQFVAIVGARLNEINVAATLHRAHS